MDLYVVLLRMKTQQSAEVYKSTDSHCEIWQDHLLKLALKKEEKQKR